MRKKYIGRDSHVFGIVYPTSLVILREKKDDERGKDDVVIVGGELKPNKTTANTLGPLPIGPSTRCEEKNWAFFSLLLVTSNVQRRRLCIRFSIALILLLRNAKVAVRTRQIDF
jgi:hypothetical protein